MTIVNWAYFDRPLPQSLFNKAIGLLSSAEADHVKRFRHWGDVHARLLAHLLLFQGLTNYHIKLNSIEIKRNQYGRPYIEGGIDFNISHSKNMVACVLSDETTVGIDVEAIQDIDMTLMQTYFQNEWNEIINSPNPLQTFYHHWTRKEAVIKADGRGFAVQIEHVTTLNDKCNLGEQTYHLRSLDLNKKYMVHLASSKAIEAPNCINFTIRQLICAESLDFTS